MISAVTGGIVPARHSSVVDSATALLLLGLVVSCATAPRLSPSVAAERIRSDVSTGMTKAEVRRVVGEPERRDWTSLRFDVSRPGDSGTNRSGECWIWGRDRLKPEAYVCFGGLDPTVSDKNP